MSSALRKWLALFAIYLQEGFAYRANGVIWILTDTVPAMIMPAVFIAASKTNGNVGGMTNAQYVQYYLSMLLLTNFVTSHLMWELSWEIKDGAFTMNLLRPVSYFQVCFIRNLSWRLLRMLYFIPIFAVLLLFYKNFLADAGYYLGWQTLLSILSGHLVSFTLVYMLSMLALYFQETRSIFEFYYIPMLFLSGQLFPIYLMPGWIVALSKALPFYYTTALPLDLLLGRLQPGDAALPLLAQGAWIAVHLAAAKLLWKFGLRQYTAVGM